MSDSLRLLLVAVLWVTAFAGAALAITYGVPRWLSFLLVLGSVMSAIYWFYRPIEVERERKAKGQCVRCGYDLRGTPQRCPECGQLT